MTVSGLFAAILLVLGLFAAYSTSYVKADAGEMTWYVKDRVWINFLAAAGVFAVFLLIKKLPVIKRKIDQLEADERLFHKYRRILFWIGAILAVIWVISTQYRAGADQAQVQKAVYLLHLKDYSMFEPGGYLAKYPNQLGLVWISYVFSLIFGIFNYTGIQLCNAAGLVLIYKSLAEIGGHLGMKRSAQLMVILLAILFIPLTMYTSFVYGTILGLACSLEALSREMKYFQDRRKKDLLLSALLIALAIQLKSNYLIFLIGMVIYGVLEGIKEKKLCTFAVPVLLIVCFLCSSAAVKSVTKHVTGYSPDQGSSSWSWIAMGLQEGKRAPGWYNGYNSGTYIDSGFDPEVQAEMAKENIRGSIERFSEEPWRAIEFFTKKTASQWNNPTFQSFWNVQVRSMGVTRSQWNWQMTGIGGMHTWTGILNLFQFIILVGAAAFCLCYDGRNNTIKNLVPAMIFIGGFVFHLIWEAKCQYTLPYFILLIPYAVEGFSTAAEWITKSMMEALLERGFVKIVIVFLLVNACILIYGGGKLEYLCEDTVEYTCYLEEERVNPEVKTEAYQVEIQDRGRNWVPNL